MSLEAPGGGQAGATETIGQPDWYYQLGIANQFLDLDLAALRREEEGSEEYERLLVMVPNRIANLVLALESGANSSTSLKRGQLMPRSQIQLVEESDGSIIFYFPFKGKGSVEKSKVIQPNGRFAFLRATTIESTVIPPRDWIADDFLRDAVVSSLREYVPAKIKSGDY